MIKQVEEGLELLRGAYELLVDADRGPYVKDLGECHYTANGGGDGLCLKDEIQTFFEVNNLDIKPQHTAEN